MSATLPATIEAAALPSLVDRAARALAGARDAAEVLEARDLASVAYDAAKSAARFAKAKGAHDSLLAAVHRAQADALEIEAGAKRRLADEYDAAQARGEVRSANERTASSAEAVGAEDLGLTHKQVHEARTIRDAEAAEPGVVRRTLDKRLDEREEPTKAALRKAVIDAAHRGLKPAPRQDRRNPLYVAPTPASRAASTIGGCLRSILDAAEPFEPEAMLRAVEHDTSRARLLDAAERVRDLLNVFLELSDAEQAND